MAINTVSGLEEFTLPGYGNSNLVFRGRLFSEGSFFDGESGGLTRVRLFVMEDRSVVYYTVSSLGEEKSRRVYILKVEGELCHVDNGRQRLTLPLKPLLENVFDLCGMEAAQEGDFRAAVAESLRAVAS
jgi:hypothetical protein